MQWLPHITLGSNFQKEQMGGSLFGDAGTVCADEVTVAEIGLAKNPHQGSDKSRIK